MNFGGYDVPNYPYDPNLSPRNFASVQTGGQMSPQNENSPSNMMDASKRGKSGGNQNLTPLTIKQIYSAHQASSDDIFKLDGRELNHITVVGTISKVTPLPTNLSVTVDDGTGQIEARIWLDPEDKSNEQQIPTWQPGTYVRIIGGLRAFFNKRNILAFKIVRIEDFNEITFHFLECIYVHLFYTKGLNFAMSNAVSTTQTTPNMPYSNPSSMYNAPVHPGSTLNEQILACIRSVNAPEGVSVQFIAQKLRRNEPEIRTALENLSGEGFCYSTIDDSHFQCTDQ